MQVQGSYGRLLQGISQQPAAVRLQGQGSDQVNMVPDVVDGLKSRMGTNHVARLRDTVKGNAAIHHYNRGDDVEEYFMILHDTRLLEIYDKQGRQCPITVANDAVPYLAEVTDPAKDVQFMTIADVTFMLNRKKVVRQRADNTPPVGNQALVFCAYGQYGTVYKIFINGQEAAFFGTNSGGDAETDTKTIKTEYIASQLRAQFQAGAFASTYNIAQDGTTLIISPKDGNTIFTVTTEDGAKGKDLVAIKNKVSSVDLLPSRAPMGYKVEVAPTGSKPESRYWLEAEMATGNNVTWKETVAPGIAKGFDRNTMPFLIERTNIVNGIAQFTMKQGDWEDRRVGDDLTNPMPSFADATTPQRISAMFMVQNRLCLTAGEAVIMSRTSRFFDFFRFSAISALDTDPIDIYSDASDVYELRHAIPMDGGTVLFADKSQFVIPGDKPLTKANALMRPATSFEINSNVRPVATGDAVMFATSEGTYSGVREFYTDSITDAKKAQPTTSHVNRLIEGSITRMVASSNINRLFAMTDKAPNRVYVYDWLWQGTEKVQSAWHKWEWPSDSQVRAMFYSNELVYVLINRGTTGLYLEVMDMGDPLPDGLEDQIRMDRKYIVNMTYDPSSAVWTSDTLPFTPTNPELAEAVVYTGWPAYIGGGFSFNLVANKIQTTFDIGDQGQSHQVVFGQMYECLYEPTPAIIKDNQERTSYIDVPTVGLVYLNLDKYPPFTVDVTKVSTGVTRSVQKTNRKGGAINNIVGYVKPKEGTEVVPIRGLSTESLFRIRCTSPHTLQLRDIEWTGTYTITRRRV